MMVKTYQAYYFRSNSKDPIIAEIRQAMMRKNGTNRVDNADLKEIEEGGGPSVACQRNWYFGKTRRPNNATVEAALRSMGMKRVIVEDKTKK